MKAFPSDLATWIAFREKRQRMVLLGRSSCHPGRTFLKHIRLIKPGKCLLFPLIVKWLKQSLTNPMFLMTLETPCACVSDITPGLSTSPHRDALLQATPLGQGWAHGGLAFTIPSAPAKTQILPVFLCGDCISKACGAKNNIWCRNISKPLQICLFDKTFKHWWYRVDILWGHLRLYKGGCHKPHFIMKVPHYWQNLVVLTSVNVLA